jgi:tetratricopeptide (TPR) repeat protein
MTDQPEVRGKQKAVAGRDAFIAGRDLIINIGAAGTVELAVPGLLPRDVPAFTGREDELAQLADLARGGSVVMTAIGGTAGVGKTALAVHAAHRLLAQFPDGQLYADLRGYTEGQDPAGPGEVLEVFLRRLGVPAEDVPVTTEERSGLLRQMLASRRVLMVLDNARTEGQVRPLLPGAGGSLVLVTSRSVLAGLEADARISLDVLSQGEAAAMLARLIGEARVRAEPGAVGELAGLCGRLPLALRIAGQLLAAHPAWSVTTMTQLLAEEQDRLGRLGAGDLQVRAAFEVSYVQLAAGDARLFRLLGLHPGADFTIAVAAALAGIAQDAVGPVLGRLAEANLITEDTAGRFGLHDLLRLFAHGTCLNADSQADREAAEARLVRHYVDLTGFLDSCVDPRLRPAAAQEAEQAGAALPSMRQALALFQVERPSLVAAVGLAAQRGWDEQVRRLTKSTGGSLTVLRYLDDLLIVEEAALTAARHAGDTAAEATALNNLGLAYWELRRFEEAIGCYRDSLAIRRETGDRYGEGRTLTNLGTAYQGLQRFEEAIGWYRESLAIRREIGDRHGEGGTLKNLGEAYECLRQPDQAAEYWRDAAAAMHDAGDQEEAVRLEQQAANAESQRRRWRRSTRG